MSASPFAYAVPGWILGSLVYLLVGSLIVRLALGVALKFFRPAWPRARYWLAVAAFGAAVVIPLVAYAGAIDRALQDQPPQWRTQAEAGAVIELTPERAREAWLRFHFTSWPAQGYARLWLLGVLILTLRGVVSSLRLGWMRRGWAPAPPEIRQRLQWPREKRLQMAPDGVPLAAGIFRPVVFLPGWLLDSLDATALRGIARHELAHLRWRDPLVDLGVRAVRSLCWPALGLWSIERVIRREREVACDLEAVDPEDSLASLAYVETLAEVAARCGRGRARGLTSGSLPAPALGVIRSGELEARARHLLSPPSVGRSWQTAMALSALLLGATAIHAVPFPAWMEAPTEETAIWGPLDHLLGFNPAIRSEITPEGPRVIIQGEALDPEASAEWQDPRRTLSELAATVLEVEARSRPSD